MFWNDKLLNILNKHSTLGKADTLTLTRRTMNKSDYEMGQDLIVSVLHPSHCQGAKPTPSMVDALLQECAASKAVF